MLLCASLLARGILNMADKHIILETNTSGELPFFAKVKLHDLGNNIYLFSVIDHPYSYNHITSETTTVVKNRAGILKRIVNNKPVIAGTITIYDNTSASGAIIALVTNPAIALTQQQVVLDYDVSFNTGLTIVTTTAQDLTVVYL